MLFIDRKRNSDLLLIDRECSGNVLLIDRELTELKDNAECTSLPKFAELVKKPSNLSKTSKKKPHHPISHSLTCFVEPIRQPCFCFLESLMGLTDGLGMSRVELKEREIAVNFFR